MRSRAGRSVPDGATEVGRLSSVLPLPSLSPPVLPGLVLALVAGASPAAAQDAARVLTRALEAYEARMERVTDYTVTQEVMGVVSTTHFVKRETDGHPVFVATSSGGEENPAPEGWGNPYRLFPELAGRATVVGSGEIEGRPILEVAVEDFEGLELEGLTVPGAGARFEPERAVFHLDTVDHLIHRVRLGGTMIADGRSGPLSMDARFRDYREVEGMLHPFRVDMTVDGMKAALTEAQLQDARRALESMQSRLEAMPEERRALARQALGPQMEQIRRMLETGVLEVALVVRSLSVNEGPPEARMPGGGSPPP